MGIPCRGQEAPQCALDHHAPPWDACQAHGLKAAAAGAILWRPRPGSPRLTTTSTKTAKALIEEPLGTGRVGRGTVKWWRPAKGYGVISCDDIAPWDIWCHFSAIEAEGFRNLTEGEPVEVDFTRIDRESFKYVADRVRQLRPEDTT